jgi:hypothetical protein
LYPLFGNNARGFFINLNNLAPLTICCFIIPAMTPIPTLAQLLHQAIDNRLLDVHTALIARVESYDAERQQVNVSPVLKRQVKTLDGTWVSEQLPVLCNRPLSKLLI